MSAVLPLGEESRQTTEISERTQEDILSAVPWKMLIWVMVSIVAVYSLSRVYMHQYAYTVGLDYFEPEFAVYWMPLFYAQATLSACALLGVSYYL